MRVRYRLIEKYFRWEGQAEWVTWGIVYENCGQEFPDRTLLFRTIPDDDRQTARHFDARVRALSPTIGGAERLIDPDWPIRFRVLPKIYVAEGSSHRQIRQYLWERLFEAMDAKARDGEPPRETYPLTQPAQHTLRETDETERA